MRYFFLLKDLIALKHNKNRIKFFLWKCTTTCAEMESAKQKPRGSPTHSSMFRETDMKQIMSSYISTWCEAAFITIFLNSPFNLFLQN